MLDLVILLSMALALTAALALLLAGFVWAPWLIGLLLVGLLIALGRVSVPTELTAQPESSQDLKKTAPPSEKDLNAQASTSQEQHETNHSIAQPVLTYRGAHPAPHLEGACTPAVEPVLTYRGAKSQLHEVIPQSLLTKWQGKYRGNPLKRPEG
jgi:hypothetical protein